MNATWTPPPDAPLISAQEDERNISAVISVSVEAPDEINGLAWLASPALPPQAVMSVAGASLSVVFPHFEGVWPIHEIRYLRNRQVGTCTITLSVTATLKDGPPETGVYSIELYPNYTPGRDALQEAVNARRNPAR